MFALSNTDSDQILNRKTDISCFFINYGTDTGIRKLIFYNLICFNPILMIHDRELIC